MRSLQNFRDAVERHRHKVYSNCYYTLGNREDAEDVTQEVLLKLAKHLGQFQYDPSQSFRGWLRRVTENAITDYVRRHRVRPEVARHLDDSIRQNEELGNLLAR